MYVFLFHLLWAVGGDLRANIFCQWFQWGGYSVDLFFILSGFILNWVYLSSPAKMNWGTYLKARAARILPLYFLTTLLSLPVPIHSFNKYGLAYLGENFSFSREIILNLFLVSGICNLPTLNGPAWSISVEFFCYLVIFPLLVVYSKKFSGTKSCGLAISIILAGVFTYCIVACYSMTPVSICDFHWYPTNIARGIFGFSAGFLLCSIFRISSNWIPKTSLINLVVFGVITIFLLIGLRCLPGYIALCAFPFLVFFTAPDRGIPASILKINIFQWMGERSYSIYLWHAMCVTILHINFMKKHLGEFFSCAVVIVFALGISELSYRYFECPAREFIRKIGRNSDSLNKS